VVTEDYGPVEDENQDYRGFDDEEEEMSLVDQILNFGDADNRG